MVNEQPMYCTCKMLFWFLFGFFWGVRRGKLGRLYVLHLYIVQYYRSITQMGMGWEFLWEREQFLRKQAVFL